MGYGIIEFATKASIGKFHKANECYKYLENIGIQKKHLKRANLNLHFVIKNTTRLNNCFCTKSSKSLRNVNS